MTILLLQLKALRKQQSTQQREIDRLTEEVDASGKHHEKMFVKLRKMDDALKLVKEDIHRQQTKVAVLKRIRELKLHSNTVKKIYHFGYNPGDIIDNKGLFLL